MGFYQELDNQFRKGVAATLRDVKKRGGRDIVRAIITQRKEDAKLATKAFVEQWVKEETQKNVNRALARQKAFHEKQIEEPF